MARRAQQRIDATTCRAASGPAAITRVAGRAAARRCAHPSGPSASLAASARLLRRLAAVALFVAVQFALVAVLALRAGVHVDALSVVAWCVPLFGAAGITLVNTITIRRLARRATNARRVGSYELVERIEAGGMGEVWRARHASLARPAAVKLIRRDEASPLRFADRAVVERGFEREAQATAALRSPHTVQLYDYGQAPDGTLFYVMELLGGIDLEKLIRLHGAQPAERVVHILRGVCHSLAEAHAAGLVHRDIKPGNVQLCVQGGDYDVVKVLDFGLVERVGARARESLTGAGDELCGTPGYIAPESTRGSLFVDARADLYSLGCVAYRLLTGTPVFDASDGAELVRAHVACEPDPMCRRTSQPIPEALEVLVLELLAKDRFARPSSAAEVGARLDAIALEKRWTSQRAAAWWTAHDDARTPAPQPLPWAAKTVSDRRPRVATEPLELAPIA